MQGLCATDDSMRDEAPVERGQLAAMGYGESEKIAVCHLRGIEQARAIDTTLIEKGDIVRPEFMPGKGA